MTAGAADADRVSRDARLRQSLQSLEGGQTAEAYRFGDMLLEAVAQDVQHLLPEHEDLHAQLLRDRVSTITRVADLARSCSRRLVEALTEAIEESAAASSASLDEMPQERLVHLTVEQLLVHAAAPPIQLSPIPAESPTAGGAQRVAVLFDQPLAISHELYALWTDAFAFGSDPGRRIDVIGVHLDWLDDACRATRSIRYCPAEDVFHESCLREPTSLDAAILVAMGPVSHRDTSRRLEAAGIFHVNGYLDAAQIADDKWGCFQRWRSADVKTPSTCLLARDLSADEALSTITTFLDSHAATDGWFLQPRHGTEAAGVEWIGPGPEAPRQVMAAWLRINREDDAILRPRVGRLALEASGEARGFDLRLHACRANGQTRIESGYLITAPRTDEPVVAVSRGAQVQRLHHLSAGLVGVDGTTGDPRQITPQTWAEICEVAASAAAVLDLDLAGIDVKLDLQDDQIVPVVLDVNPRPAGLLHADLVRHDVPPLAALEAGVGEGLWRRLSDGRDARPRR